MTRQTLIEDYNYIRNNVGNIPDEKMIAFYETYLHGADSYLFGAEADGDIVGYFSEDIDLKYCSCQTDHKKNVQYLRYRPHRTGSREIAKREDSIYFGKAADIYTLYACKTKSGRNAGYCFEKSVYNYFNDTTWKQDNKASDKGGDITIEGREVQMKFAPKDGLATITSTNKILNKISKLLKSA